MFSGQKSISVTSSTGAGEVPADVAPECSHADDGDALAHNPPHAQLRRGPYRLGSAPVGVQRLAAMTQLRPEPAWAAATGHARVEPQGADDDPGRAADRVMIAERINRYGWGYDERNRDLLGDCFTADGIWEGSIMGLDQVGPFEGRDAVVAFLAEFWDIQTDQRRHIFTNIVVEDLTGGTAVAHAYLLLTASAEGAMTPVTNGPYRLEMRKDQGVWRIARLCAGFDAPF